MFEIGTNVLVSNRVSWNSATITAVYHRRGDVEYEYALVDGTVGRAMQWLVQPYNEQHLIDQVFSLPELYPQEFTKKIEAEEEVVYRYDYNGPKTTRAVYARRKR